MISIFHKGREVLLNEHFANSKGLVRNQQIPEWKEFERIVKAHNRFQIAHQAELKARRNAKENRT